MEQLQRQVEALQIELSTEKQKSYKLEQELGYLRQKQRYDKTKTPHSSHENISRIESEAPSRGRSVSLPGPKLPDNKRDYIQLSEDDDDDVEEPASVGVEIEQREEKIVDNLYANYEVINKLDTWVSLREITKNVVIRDVKSGIVETVEEIKCQINDSCADTVKKSVSKLIKTTDVDLNVVKKYSVPNTSLEIVKQMNSSSATTLEKELLIKGIPADDLSTNEISTTDLTFKNIETSKFVFNKISLASMINQWDIAFSASLTQRELREQPRRLINSFLTTKDEKVLQIAKINLPKVVLSQAEKELITKSFKKWKCLETDDDQNAKLARTASTVVFRNLDREEYETVKRQEVLSVCQGIRKRIIMFQEIYDKLADSEYSSDDESEDEVKNAELTEVSENVDIFTADGDLVDENTKIIVCPFPCCEVQKPVSERAGPGFTSALCPPGVPPPPMFPCLLSVEATTQV